MLWASGLLVVVPEKMSTATLALSPVASPAAPPSTGRAVVTVLPSLGCVSVGCGATVSTVNVAVALRPASPLSSDCDACAVYTPSVSAGCASTVHVAPLRLVVSSCSSGAARSLPRWTLTVTVCESPATLPAAPVKRVAATFVVLPAAGVASVTAGVTSEL